MKNTVHIISLKNKPKSAMEFRDLDVTPRVGETMLIFTGETNVSGTVIVVNHVIGVGKFKQVVNIILE